MRPIVASFAVVASALVVGACGGGGNSDAEHAGVEAFPDVLEIARAELGDTAQLEDVTVSDSRISFVNVQFGRIVRVVYNTEAVFTGSEPIRRPPSAAAVFSITDVPGDAPGALLAAIQERENGDVAGFRATLSRDRRGNLIWRAKATVDGKSRTFVAGLSGALR